MHRLDFRVYSHPKKFLGNGVRTGIFFTGKFPLPEAQWRVKPATLHHAGQQAQHTSNRAIVAPDHNNLYLCPSTPPTLPPSPCGQSWMRPQVESDAVMICTHGRCHFSHSPHALKSDVTPTLLTISDTTEQ